jgi:hypothetical protein
MKWQKRGLIYEPDRSLPWSRHYGILPTPDYDHHLNSFKVFFSTADEKHNSRLYLVNLDPKNPKNKMSQLQGPLLDVGSPGCFDDSGVVPSCILKDEDSIKLYYIGFQRLEKVPYLLMSGLAHWDTNENRFLRFSSTPILDRTHSEPFIRSAPVVLKEDSYRMWYVSASHWEAMYSRTAPKPKKGEEIIFNKMIALLLTYQI